MPIMIALLLSGGIWLKEALCYSKYSHNLGKIVKEFDDSRILVKFEKG